MKLEVICTYCKKSFFKEENQIAKTKRNFCSRKCSNTFYRGEHSPNPPKLRICKKCAGEYICANGYRSEAYCKSCRSEVTSESFKLVTLEQIHASLHLKNKHPSWFNAQVRGFNRQWNKHLLKLPCAHCGYKPHVELCHRKAITLFTETATLGEVNDPSNVIQLCRNHHWELDHGLLFL